MSFKIALGIVLTITCCNSANGTPYKFGYQIQDAHVTLHQWEEKTGDLVKGAYSFLQPDGNVRRVDYEVSGAKGFHYVVNFRKPSGFPLGHLKFPDDYREPLIFSKPLALVSDLFQ